MKIIKIPVFTEEYGIIVYLGTPKELIKPTSKYVGVGEKTIEKDFANKRGLTFNCYPDKHPLVVIDSTLDYYVALATFAHEISHAMQYVAEYVGIDDKNGEFEAHGISTSIRVISKYLKLK